MVHAQSVNVNINVSKLCCEGRVKAALQKVQSTIQQGTLVSVDSYICILEGSIRARSLEHGMQVHSHIVKCGFDSNLVLGNILVDMYAKLGSLVGAVQVFNRMPLHNVFSWTAIISAYVRQEECEDAIVLFHQMQRSGLVPDKVLCIIVIKACASVAMLELGKQVHSYIKTSGFESDAVVKNTLIDMYAKCGSIEDAWKLFTDMYELSVVSWTAMITGFVQHGLGVEALSLFEQMQKEGMKPNEVTLVSILRACASVAALERGRQVHTQIIYMGFERDNSIGSALVGMYGKCGNMEYACEVFYRMHERNVVSWTAMIVEYAQQGLSGKAFALFEQMKHECVNPDKITYLSILQACASPTFLEWGKQLHVQIVISSFKLDVSIGNALVEMYSKCGSIDHAGKVFNKMCERDVISWNTIIEGYVSQGFGRNALQLFEQMLYEDAKPDEVTFVSILKACASLEDLEQGKEIHAQIMKSGFFGSMFVVSTLVDMYAKCGCIENARKIFDNISKRDEILWNVMIAGYTLQGLGREALTLFKQMQVEGLKVDRITFANILKACTRLADLEQGKRIHAHIINSCFEFDSLIGSSLVDMYAECGDIQDAQHVFNKMSEKNIVLWTSMIAAYAQQGYGEEAIELFEEMQEQSINPNEITFIGILSSCSHAGLLEEGCHFYDSMSRHFGITPTMDHYACMVDLFSRAGHLEQAVNFVQKMPIQPSAVVWMTLLGACNKYGNMKIANLVMEQILKLNTQSASAYVLLSNIYAAHSRCNEFE